MILDTSINSNRPSGPFSGSGSQSPSSLGLQKLPHMTWSCLEVEMDGQPALLTLEDEEDAPDRGYCFWVPRSVRTVLLEMMGLGLLRSPVMALLCLSNVFGMLGFYCPFVYISNKAIEETGAGKAEAALLLSVIGITNTIGLLVFSLPITGLSQCLAKSARAKSGALLISNVWANRPNLGRSITFLANLPHFEPIYLI